MLYGLLKATASFLATFSLVVRPCPAFPLDQRGASGDHLVTLATFNSSAAFLADQSILNKPLDKLKAIEKGGIDTYYGVQVEDSQTGYVLVVFKDQHPKEHAPVSVIKKLLKDAANGNIDVQHVLPNGDISQLLTAPVTEISTIDLLPGHTLKELAPLLEELRPMFDAVTGQFGATHWGPVIEVPTEVHNFLGWASVEAHNQAVSTPEFQNLFNRVLEIATGFSKHTRLTKH